MDATDRHLEFLATIKESDMTTCCPECGSIKFKQAFDGERECKDCGQSWYKDVNYSSPFPLLRCEGCNTNYADSPSTLCPGCQAYREHQQ